MSKLKLPYSPTGREYFAGYTVDNMLLKTEVFAILHLLKKHPNACVYLGDVDTTFKPDPLMPYTTIGFEWNVPLLKLIQPNTPNFWEFALSCKEHGSRFVVCYLVLNAEELPLDREDKTPVKFNLEELEKFTGETMSPHANMLILDWKLKTLERFEPNGGFFDSYEQYKGYGQVRLNKALAKEAAKFELKYIPPKNVCPVFGLQTLQHTQLLKNGILIEGDVGGWCQTWSVFYADMRLTYPDIDPATLMSLTIKMFQNKDMSKWIRDYQYHVVEESRNFNTTRAHSTKSELQQIIEYTKSVLGSSKATHVKFQQKPAPRTRAQRQRFKPY